MEMYACMHAEYSVLCSRLILAKGKDDVGAVTNGLSHQVIALIDAACFLPHFLCLSCAIVCMYMHAI